MLGGIAREPSAFVGGTSFALTTTRELGNSSSFRRARLFANSSGLIGPWRICLQRRFAECPARFNHPFRDSTSLAIVGDLSLLGRTLHVILKDTRSCGGVLPLEAITQVAGLLMLKRAEMMRRLDCLVSAEDAHWRQPATGCRCGRLTWKLLKSARKNRQSQGRVAMGDAMSEAL